MTSTLAFAIFKTLPETLWQRRMSVESNGPTVN